MKTLTDAIQQFRNDIDDSDYANLGAKGKYLTVPYRLKFVREYFGERIRIVTDSFDLPDGIHKFKTEIFLDDKLVSTGLSKQTQNKDKEFEKQSTVSCGRALSFLGFFGDEIATAEEMEQFLNKPKVKQEVKTQTKTIPELANDWIDQMKTAAQHSKSSHYFEKNLTPIKEKYKDEIHLIATDPIEQLRVDTEYNKLKSQIQTRGTNGR
jgi:hypothetical protein|tara:strand:- start:1596 stop:2222 length:627 start_codon:yes stop_codon:yes gene_type:complete